MTPRKPRRVLSIPDAYVAYTRREGDCIIWQRGKVSAGYGAIIYQGRQQPAHRVFYQEFIGPIAPGLHLHHTCDRKECVNLAHLEAVTPQEHVDRTPRNMKHKTHCAQGHPFAPENTKRRTYVDHKGIRRYGRKCAICERLAQLRHEPLHPRQPPSHCPQGHAYTPENTQYERVRPKEGLNRTTIRCRICRQYVQNQIKARRHEAHHLPGG
jgi:hypothetical protein